jgi:hypothetical protein
MNWLSEQAANFGIDDDIPSSLRLMLSDITLQDLFLFRQHSIPALLTQHSNSIVGH